MENLDRYTDYRDFLYDRFKIKKAENKKFSYQYCAIKLSVSRGYLKLVFSKRRHITIEKIFPICNLLGLNWHYKQWLLYLFLQNRCDDHEIKQIFKVVIKNYLSDQAQVVNTNEPGK